MHSKLAAALIALTITPAAHAHDFWIEPADYTPSPGEPVALSILTGHGEDTAAWPAASHRIIGLRSISAGGLTSHVTSPDMLKPGLELSFQRAGLHMVFIESTNAFSRLPAEKFNAYVDEEGITPIAAHRLKTAAQQAEGTELYSRRGKALVEVGCASGSDDTWAMPVGLSLEILPTSNPFDWDAGDPLGVEVRFHGAPLAASTLHVTPLDGEGYGFTIKTGMDGRADLSKMMKEGRWLVHTVWSEPAEGLLQDATYQTVFSSLTFETQSACEAGEN